MVVISLVAKSRDSSMQIDSSDFGRGDMYGMFIGKLIREMPTGDLTRPQSGPQHSLPA